MVVMVVVVMKMMMMLMLVGENVADDDSMMRSQLAKTEISLTLSNKHELPDSNDTDKTRLLLRFVPITHYLSVHLCMCLSVCLSVRRGCCCGLYQPLTVCLSISACVCLCICLSDEAAAAVCANHSLSVCPSLSVSVCVWQQWHRQDEAAAAVCINHSLSVCPSLRVSVCVSVCQSLCDLSKTLVPRVQDQDIRPQDQGTKWKSHYLHDQEIRYRKRGMIGLCRFLPVEYDSNVDVAHSVVIQLFRSTSMIHSTSIRKHLPQTLNTGLWPQWWLLYERFVTLDIFIKTETKTSDLKTKRPNENHNYLHDWEIGIEGVVWCGRPTSKWEKRAKQSDCP